MAMVLPDDEQRGFDDEPEIAVLERRAVAITHQEADQSLVLLRDLLRSEVEGDASAVGYGEISRERTIERKKTVVEDVLDVLWRPDRVVNSLGLRLQLNDAHGAKN